MRVQTKANLDRRTGSGAWTRLIAILLVLFPVACRGAEVLLVHGRSPHSAEEEHIRRLVEFYGLTLREVRAESSDNAAAALANLASPGLVAILTPRESLPWLRSIQSSYTASSQKSGRVPVLVFGITARETDQELRLWSRSAIQGCEELPQDSRPKAIEVGAVADVSRMLAGHELPAVASPTCKLRFEASAGVQVVLTAREGHSRSPVMIRCRTAGGEVFFVPELKTFDTAWVGEPSALSKAFSSMSPFILFLRYAAGDNGWRLDEQYANFTIDDPWLTQPYGRLDYAALLDEMKKHQFHSTIAFVPWNFDRSESATIELFRSHPDMLSIAVHGNNHTHREFGSYSGNPLAGQVAGIRQAVARMERFRAITGLPYDRFMIFPHAVAPEATFAELRKSQFSGTANSMNVPLGSALPEDPMFLLRSYTLRYGGILSLFRYSAEGRIPRLEIAIQSFLGNPILFYGHEKMFENGIGAFNEFADEVNRANQHSRWTGLGEIARHLHLTRKKGAGEFDVQMFSNEADINNTTERDGIYNITLTADGLESVQSVAVDGHLQPFRLVGGSLVFRVMARANQLAKVRVRYPKGLDLSLGDVSKKDLKVRALRWAADFRDLYLSRSLVGSALSSAYYRLGLDKAELFLERTWWIILLCLGLPFIGNRYLRRNAANRPSNSDISC